MLANLNFCALTKSAIMRQMEWSLIFVNIVVTKITPVELFYYVIPAISRSKKKERSKKKKKMMKMIFMMITEPFPTWLESKLFLSQHLLLCNSLRNTIDKILKHYCSPVYLTLLFHSESLRSLISFSAKNNTPASQENLEMPNFLLATLRVSLDACYNKLTIL